ncbi:hypothetical protein [Streptomyces sp. NPDC093261]|uniref:hypothetical protein n=1 Tax=Streptomyces sp. NPDC093261 TaxID=3366037 RepID=UPI0037F7178F
MSPHEMTSSQLEDLIAWYREVYGETDFANDRIEQLEEILKERAEAGTYDMVPSVTPRHVH